MIADGAGVGVEEAVLEDERRAIIDIGSNTVRLVIYGGPPRAPEVLWNEKVSARLGRDLETTGAMPAAAMDEALAALSRYAIIIRDLGIANVETVATAAARDAANGDEFIARAAGLGFTIQVLSGEEEACASAWGAIGAFPGAEGIVADLGGGSLELVAVGDGDCGAGTSYPLGTLRLPALRASGRFEHKVAKLLNGATDGFPAGRGRPLYMIGGTWRAFATYAMRRMDHPLTDPHGLMLDVGQAAEVARQVAGCKPAQLAEVRGISAMRAEKLPDAAALLLVLLDRLDPGCLIFSSWGLREGLHFRRLDRRVRSTDPLLAGIAAFAAPRAVTVADAARFATWAAAIVRTPGVRAERLRLAAAQLGAALHRVEPNLRSAHALGWALDKRWIGIDHSERAMLGAALRASLGITEPHPRLAPLASKSDLREAIAWGLSLRLAQRLGAGSTRVLSAARLTVQDGELTLSIAPDHAALATKAVAKDLHNLARWLDLKPALAPAGMAQDAVAGAARGKNGMRTSSGSPSSVRKV